MKVTTRLTLLFLAFLVLITGAVFFWGISENRIRDELFSERAQKTGRMFDKMLELKGNSLKTLAFDYTFWDEMVKFVSRPSKRWAEQNIDISLNTYKVSAAWVFKTDFSKVYSVNNLKDDKLSQSPLGKEELKKLFSPGWFPHFFAYTPAGLLEFRGAPIQPSADSARKTTPQGFFLTAKLWDGNYLNEIGDITDCRLELLPSGANKRPADRIEPAQGLLSFSRILPDREGQPLVYLLAVSELPSFKEFSRWGRLQLVGLVIFFTVFLAAGSSLILFWIGIPLDELNRSLKQRDLKPISKLTKDRSEFGDLARQISRSFDQMQELQVFHDAAVGRELKMIEKEQEVNSLLKELGREARYK
ncbi:hypothetical protein HZC35_04035 [Candidatus Saganbacteria bacterium]|nr:hypothetical protein [Candidatus Saganbacteria bacterium]